MGLTFERSALFFREAQKVAQPFENQKISLGASRRNLRRATQTFETQNFSLGASRREGTLQGALQGYTTRVSVKHLWVTPPNIITYCTYEYVSHSTSAYL